MSLDCGWSWQQTDPYDKLWFCVKVLPSSTCLLIVVGGRQQTDPYDKLWFCVKALPSSTCLLIVVGVGNRLIPMTNCGSGLWPCRPLHVFRLWLELATD